MPQQPARRTVPAAASFDDDEESFTAEIFAIEEAEEACDDDDEEGAPVPTKVTLSAVSRSDEAAELRKVRRNSFF